jgi:hypothetical protein
MQILPSGGAVTLPGNDAFSQRKKMLISMIGIALIFFILRSPYRPSINDAALS